MVRFKGRWFISAGKPVQKLGQSVAGDIIGEPHVWASRLEDCFENGRLLFAMKKYVATIPESWTER